MLNRVKLSGTLKAVRFQETPFIQYTAMLKIDSTEIHVPIVALAPVAKTMQKWFRGSDEVVILGRLTQSADGKLQVLVKDALMDMKAEEPSMSHSYELKHHMEIPQQS